MAMWICPYCGQKDTEKRALAASSTPVDVADLYRAVLWVFSCHNPECNASTTFVRFYVRNEEQRYAEKVLGKLHIEQRLIPPSRAKVFPEYVPEFVRDDYREACEIESTSPKASAALSRRCLQSIIRDYYGVSKARLIDEINALEGHVEPQVQQAFHALREIGNVGAHPERDPRLIVDVEPGEATAMIDLIELLIDETYVAKHLRDAKIARAITIAANKKHASDT